MVSITPSGAANSPALEAPTARCRASMAVAQPASSAAAA